MKTKPPDRSESVRHVVTSYLMSVPSLAVAATELIDYLDLMGLVIVRKPKRRTKTAGPQ